MDTAVGSGTLYPYECILISYQRHIYQMISTHTSKTYLTLLVVLATKLFPIQRIIRLAITSVHRRSLDVDDNNSANSFVIIAIIGPS